MFVDWRHFNRKTAKRSYRKNADSVKFCIQTLEKSGVFSAIVLAAGPQVHEPEKSYGRKNLHGLWS
jgi:hypothetical protein